MKKNVINYFKKNGKVNNVTIFLVGVLFSIIIFYVGSRIYFNNLERELLESQTSKVSSNELISIYLENENGSYEYSSENNFPTEGYEFNEEKSYCVNESTLTWDGLQITVNTKGSDSCYVYFDECENKYIEFDVSDSLYLNFIYLNGVSVATIINEDNLVEYSDGDIIYISSNLDVTNLYFDVYSTDNQLIKNEGFSTCAGLDYTYILTGQETEIVVYRDCGNDDCFACP